jgi:hypothetical protein
MSKVTPYLKAIVGALIAGLGVLALALEDEKVTSGEWVNIAIATLTALGVVWAIPNKDPEGEHQDESVQPAARPVTQGHYPARDGEV